ncbi:unnamed protein product [Closterium sp. NIES-65]|nr:unnamed protein product [Closterium sp. NIES-65]
MRRLNQARNRRVRELSGLSGISKSELWTALVVLLLACAARGARGYDANGSSIMNGNGSSRSHVITHRTGSTTDVVTHGNRSSSDIVMRGHGSTGHRRQLQLVGQVKAFEAELQYYSGHQVSATCLRPSGECHVPVPIRTHRERANLLVEPLGFAFNSSNQQRVLLHYLEHDPNAPQLMQLQNVYVTAKGTVFNRTHSFVRPGCGRFNEISFSAEQQVHVLPAAFSWAYSQGFNFYHFIVETMPLFLVAAPLLPRLLPSIPIIAEDMQWDAYKRFGEVLIGVKYGAMRSLPLVKADLFFVHTLYEPMTQDCGNPSTLLWQSLRRTHLLHPRGLPLFRPDWSYQPPQPLSPQQAQALPPDWVVVLAKRLSKKRSISNFNEVQAVVERMFPKERIVLFTGSLTVLEARDLFRRTRLFIAGHGAALTNLVFMPERASVLEIRPDKCAVLATCSVKHGSS